MKLFALCLFAAACAVPLDGLPQDLETINTPPARNNASGALTFLSMGDWGYLTPCLSDVAASMGAVAEREGAQFVVALGDADYRAYFGGGGFTEAVQPFLQHVGLPMYSVAGNHEYDAGGWAEQLAFAETEPLFHFPSLNYSVRARVDADTDALFVFADSCHLQPGTYCPRLPREVVDAHWAWLDGALAAEADHKVLAVHYPPLSAGGHGDQPYGERLLALLRRHGATTVLAGHDHVINHLRSASPGPDPAVDVFVVGTAAEKRRVAYPQHPALQFAASECGFGLHQLTAAGMKTTLLDSKGEELYSVGG